MSPELLQSIAKIEKNDGSVAGVGFAIANGILLTCAHVVERALGLDSNIEQKPTGLVRLKFSPFNSDNHFTGTVKFWNREADISILVINKESSQDILGLEIAGHIESKFLWGHDYKVFGFPQNDNIGRWAKGLILDEGGTGLLQIEDIKLQGQRVKEGYSGSPVLDINLESIIGMVKAVDPDENKKIAFVIPTKMIIETIRSEIDIGYIDKTELIEKELNFLYHYKQYESYMTILEQIMNVEYDEDIIAGILYLIKKLHNERFNQKKFRSIFEYLAMGYIPYEWNIERLVSEENKDFFLNAISALFNQSRRELSNLKLGVPVPIVLVIMNEKELGEIVSKDIFNLYPYGLKRNFCKFISSVERNGRGNWHQNYDTSIRNWKPFREKTIEKLINESLNKARKETRKALVPVFIDIHDINKNSFRNTLKILRERGCILILDSISLHHPEIQKSLIKTMLDAFPRTIIARVLPENKPIEFVNQLIVVLELYSEFEFTKRLQEDDNCGLLWEETNLNMWLSSRTKELVTSDIYSQFDWA